MQSVLRDPQKQDRYIATAQLGITVASLGLGMYGEHVLADGDLPVDRKSRHARVPRVAHARQRARRRDPYLLPHRRRRDGAEVSRAQRAETMVLWITPPMLWTKNVLYPFVVGLNVLGNLVLRIVGVQRQVQHAERYYTPEELPLIVQESEELGALRAESGQMLQELFEFGDLTAGAGDGAPGADLRDRAGDDARRDPRGPRLARRTRGTRSTSAISITSSA